MKKIFLLAAGAMASLAAAAVNPVVSNMRVARTTAADGTENLTITARITTPDGLPSGREVWVRPYVTAADGRYAVGFPAAAVAGRNRFIQAERRGYIDFTYVRASRSLDHTYNISMPWYDWMEHSTVTLDFEEHGCCREQKGVERVEAATINLAPQALAELPAFFVSPEATREAKTRSIEGSAYIDFPVNVTAIRPDYRRNPSELAKINATIDSVAGDRDVTISALSIKGFASPEGPYDNNVRLAAGRTEALKNYVVARHHFPASVITTSSEPEDWAGLLAWVEKSDIADRQGIIDVINTTSLAPDAREWRLKSRYPEQYRYLLAEVYPSLRHSDYRIDYTIRSFTDPAEILAKAKTDPGKLSMGEFALAASTIEAGSPEWTALWATASRCFPDAEAPAVNVAYGRALAGDNAAALRVLEGLPATPSVAYARAAILARSGDLAAAAAALAPARGSERADALAREIAALRAGTGITILPAFK